MHHPYKTTPPFCFLGKSSRRFRRIALYNQNRKRYYPIVQSLCREPPPSQTGPVSCHKHGFSSTKGNTNGRCTNCHKPQNIVIAPPSPQANQTEEAKRQQAEAEKVARRKAEEAKRQAAELLAKQKGRAEAQALAARRQAEAERKARELAEREKQKPDVKRQS